MSDTVDTNNAEGGISSLDIPPASQKRSILVGQYFAKWVGFAFFVALVLLVPLIATNAFNIQNIYAPVSGWQVIFFLAGYFVFVSMAWWGICFILARRWWKNSISNAMNGN